MRKRNGGNYAIGEKTFCRDIGSSADNFRCDGSRADGQAGGTQRAGGWPRGESEN